MPDPAPAQDAAFFEQAVCSCKAPEWIVAEEWAILSEDGTVGDMVPGGRGAAERHLQLHRDGIPGRRPPEPGARLMSRLIITGPGRRQVTAWIGRATPGDPPAPVPAFLRGGFTC